MHNVTLRPYGLYLRHTTSDGYVGTVLIPTPTDDNYAYEQVLSPQGRVIHETSFFKCMLGTESNLLPYVEGMTRSARRRSLTHEPV